MSAPFFGPLCAFLSSCTWALGVTSYARLARTLPPWAINATRALVALPIFTVLSLVATGGPAATTHAIAEVGMSRAGLLALSMVGSYAVGDVLFLRSAAALGAPAALAIASVFPVPTAIAGVLWQGDVMTPARWLGLAAVVAGTIIVILSAARELRSEPQQSTRTPRGRVAIGVALALGTALFWALNVWGVAEGSRGLSPVTASLVRVAMGLVLSPLAALVMAPMLGRSVRPLLTPWAALRPVLWIFAVESVGGALVYTYGLTHSSMAVGAALSSLAPVVAVPFALAFRTERFSWRKSAGIALVVAGLLALV